MKVLLATTNKAKIRYYGTRLKENGIDIMTLGDLKINCDVEELGNTPVENAVIKAQTYHNLSGMTTIALDDGLFFEKVPDSIQPGTHVRRIQDKVLNDKEMIDYYVNLVNQYGNDGLLLGYFLKGVAIVSCNDTYTFDYKAKRVFTNQQSKVIDEGYPLASIQMIPTFNKFKSELTKEEEKLTIDIEQKDIFSFICDTLSKIEKNQTKIKNI